MSTKISYRFKKVTDCLFLIIRDTEESTSIISSAGHLEDARLLVGALRISASTNVDEMSCTKNIEHKELKANNGTIGATHDNQ